MKKLIEAYVYKYNLIELRNPRDGILYEERMWKNKAVMSPMKYSESEIKSYIEDMDKYEIMVLKQVAKNLAKLSKIRIKWPSTTKGVQNG